MAVRWPEVLLICGMPAISQGSLLYIKNTELQYSFRILGFFILGFVTMVISTMLYLGFVRTYVTSFSQHQSVSTLMSAGKIFFWRFLFFGLLMGFMLFLIYLLISSLFTRSENAITLYNANIEAIKIVAANIIMMKFLILVPAVIIAYDIKVLHALKRIIKYRFFDAHQVIYVYLINLAVLYLHSFISFYIDKSDDLKFIAIKAALIFASQLFTLLVSLTAVGFVIFVDMHSRSDRDT